MSFKDLKAKRDARTNQTVSSASKTDTGRAHESQLYSPLHGSGIEIKSALSRGRGLWATANFRPGTKLLSLQPHIHALSSRFLETHCSNCAVDTQVLRCTKCLKVSYCSAKCQKDDWKLHKEECKAIVRWTAASPGGATPADSIRALGRLLWSRQSHRPDSSWWLEVQAMQSNRESLSMATQEAFTHLAQSLVMYLDIHSPEGLRVVGIDSSSALIDFMSKFTSNSFTLTSPTLDPVGVAISPLPALINHSCRPNAVILFPHSIKTKQPVLNVVAISPIKPGEEIEAAYIDITLPREVRQKMLQETYSFVCQCVECSVCDLDPRECIFCTNCPDGLVSTANTERTRCIKCDSPMTITHGTRDTLRVANEGLEKADMLQGTDPEQALRLANNLTALVLPFSPPCSHPRLALMRLKHSLLISEMGSGTVSVDEVIRNAAEIVAGLQELLVKGHPIRGIAIAELGKLFCVDEPPFTGETNEKVTFPPRGYQRLSLAKDILMRACGEVEIGFGPGGGDLGTAIRRLLENTDKEMTVFRKGVKNLQATASK